MENAIIGTLSVLSGGLFTGIVVGILLLILKLSINHRRGKHVDI